MAEQGADHDPATRRLWPALALPGTVWLIALFLVPFYAVMAVAFSGNINIFGEPIPAWNPLDWQFATFSQVVSDSVSGPFREAWSRTGIYTLASLVICVGVGIRGPAGWMKDCFWTVIRPPDVAAMASISW